METSVPVVVRSGPGSPTESAPTAAGLAEGRRWRLADGVLFSVVSSLVIWCVLLASLYRALS